MDKDSKAILSIAAQTLGRKGGIARLKKYGREGMVKMGKLSANKRQLKLNNN